MTDLIKTIHATEWNAGPSATAAADATSALENGQVLHLPRLAFTLAPEERRFLSPQWSDGKAKNVSYDPAAHQVRHTAAEGADRSALAAMMDRYANAARLLVTSLCPAYTRDLAWGLTSFRPISAANREASIAKTTCACTSTHLLRVRCRANVSCACSATLIRTARRVCGN